MSGSIDDLVLRASIKDELSAPLERVKDKVDDVGDAVDKMSKKVKVAEPTTGALSRGFDRVLSSGMKFSRWAGGAALSATKWLGAGLVAVAGAAATVGIKTAASMEQSAIAFETMLGSGKKAKAFLDDLADFAAKTPFDFPGLQDSASKLIAAGVDANKVIPIMTTLGDVTAGMGTGAFGIERATNAIQQMIAAGKVQAQDLNQLRDAGIPVYDLLSSALGKSKAEISELVSGGKLGADALTKMMKALETGKGLERFNGLMEKQSKSLGGQWATLQDTVQMGLADAFKPAIPVLGNLVGKLSGLAEAAGPGLKKGVGTAVRFGKSLVKGIENNGLDGAVKRIKRRFGVDLTKPLDKARDVVDDLAAVWKDSLQPAFEGVGGVLPGVLAPLTLVDDVLSIMADHTDATRVALYLLIGALTIGKGVAIGFAAGQKISLIWLKAHTVGTKTHLVVSKAAWVATKLWAGAQKALNLVMRMSPLGMIVTAVGLLIAAWVILYNRSETVRKITDKLWGVLKTFGKWIGGLFVSYIKLVAKAWLLMAEYGIRGFSWLAKAAFKAFDFILAAAEKGLGWVPGLGDKIKNARAAFSEFGDKVTEKLDRVADKIAETRRGLDDLEKPRSATFTLTTRTVHTGKTSGNDFIGGMTRPGGDTATSRGGSSSLGATLGAHASVNAALGGRYSVSNALVGGGGRGRGSGDHQRGRAVDVVGPNLPAYAREVRARGGYAAIHGQGSNKHVHAVPAGDTPTPRSVRRGGGSNGGAPNVHIEKIEVVNPHDDADIAAAVSQGIADYFRDREER